MSYQQLHADKAKLNGLSSILHHLIDRQRIKSNPNIDLSRSHPITLSKIYRRII